MRSILTALLAVCFSLPLVGDEKKDFESTKAKAVGGDAAALQKLNQIEENTEDVSEGFGFD